MMKRSYSELLRSKGDEALSVRGADVLEKMENALMKELILLERMILQVGGRCASMMDEINGQLERARKNAVLVDIGTMIENEQLGNEVELGYKKKFGKLVEVMKHPILVKPLPRWGAPFAYERARALSKKLLIEIINLGNAQAEKSFVDEELGKTTRRVNALREIIIPDIRKKRKMLEEWVEEERREELGRRQWAERMVFK